MIETTSVASKLDRTKVVLYLIRLKLRACGFGPVWGHAAETGAVSGT
jgi:hypothetical protein